MRDKQWRYVMSRYGSLIFVSVIMSQKLTKDDDKLS